MKEIDLEELKRLQLEILIKIHNFCEANGISYFLGYGTLIGAIRHKGYIPWDDDIDIGMPRPSYDKFLKLFNGTYPNLEVLAPEINWDFYAPYANVFDNRTLLEEGDNSHRGINIGVKIDIFPIDGVPSWRMIYRLERVLTRGLNKILEIKRYKVSNDNSFANVVKQVVLKGIVFPFRYSYIQKLISSIALSCSFRKSLYADKITFLNKGQTRVNRTDFEEYIDIEFEGYIFKTIKNYDTYLKKIYGDYMELPPKEKRIPMHNFKAWWK